MVESNRCQVVHSLNISQGSSSVHMWASPVQPILAAQSNREKMTNATSKTNKITLNPGRGQFPFPITPTNNAMWVMDGKFPLETGRFRN